MKNTLIFIAFVLLVLGFLYSISGSKAPRIPENALHKIIDNPEICMECHSPGGQAPRKKDHLPKDQCLECHKVKRNRKID